MANTVTHPTQVNFGQALLFPLRALVLAIEWIREANRMANEYTHLSHKTDASLAKAGFSREDLPKVVVSRANGFWKFP
ncbi:hypothetical protein [Chachezhania antarctica]|uniref:hypothetical protein n=1 Tax=Chachezhania antarctica TaxID=2340860 RepID=UPI000EB33EDA|nr:hypothetical protein [Chachezhania antarctica]|tara:strand:+ start:834 stop:1067 length:234 start_codon:yes stop_codon:yes gene_type:complete